jgi:septal ring factor EnvC (AmiA/AmiB activator)
MELNASLAEIIAFLTMFAAIIGGYYRLSGGIATLEEKFTKMEARNTHADQETEAVKIEQAEQKTTVAVMAQQIANQSKTIDRIDRNIEELMKRGG